MAPGQQLHYFAYGSNMALARLRQRAPSARRLAVCSLAGHDLRFHKVGRDGSGKCDAFATGDPEHRVLGVLYTIAVSCKPALDAVEGLGNGYGEKIVTLTAFDGRSFDAVTYYATAREPGLQPFSWYLDHVLRGARECGLPPAYLEGLAAISCREDPDPRRDRAERAIHLKPTGSPA